MAQFAEYTDAKPFHYHRQYRGIVRLHINNLRGGVGVVQSLLHIPVHAEGRPLFKKYVALNRRLEQEIETVRANVSDRIHLGVYASIARNGKLFVDFSLTFGGNTA